MEKKVTVMFSFGHGSLNPTTNQYVTPGKRSPIWKDGTQYFEGVGNREIGEYIIEDMLLYKIPFVVLSHAWLDLPLSSQIYTENKVKGNAFGMAVHSNAGGGTGIEVFTSPGDTAADPMATISIEEFPKIFPEYKDRIRKDYKDGDPDKEERFAILTKTKHPWFLPEAFFMDREEECKTILMNPNGLKKIAKWHFNTIMRIIDECYK